MEGERQKHFKVALFPSHGRLLLLYKHYKGHQNLNREALLLCFISLYPIRVRSVVGWATKREGGGNLLHPPTSFPPSPWAPPCLKKPGHQSAELSLVKWPAFEPCPGTAEPAGRSTSLGELRSWLEKKKSLYCDCELRDRRVSVEEELRTLGQRQRHET